MNKSLQEKALAGGVETRARSNSKDSDCSTTPDSTRSQEAVNIVLEERLKEDSSSLRKERKSRKVDRCTSMVLRVMPAA